MKEISLKCKIVTPMFLAGADSGRAELRTASVVGAMRYWFRALAGRVCADDLRKVKLMEEAVFGSQRRAGLVRVATTNAQGLGVELIRDEERSKFAGLVYLAGQGLLSNDGPTRRFLSPNTSFQIRLSGPQAEVNAAYASVLMLSLFGGLGSRSRKGFGSFSVAAQDCLGSLPSPPGSLQTAESIASILNGCYDLLTMLYIELGCRSERVKGYEVFTGDLPVLNQNITSYPSFSCFRAKVGCLGGTAPQDWKNAMDKVGKRLWEFRRKSDKASGGNGFARTNDYVEVVKDYLDGTLLSNGNQDLVHDIFGLPTHYQKGEDTCATLSWTYELSRDAEETVLQNRRASPVWVSFHPAAQGRICATILVFGSVFLPNDAKEVLIPGDGCQCTDLLCVKSGDIRDFNSIWSGLIDRRPACSLEEGNWK